MFTKNALLGSLSFVTVLIVGHLSVAIAQSDHVLSWHKLSQVNSSKILPLVPSRLLSGFADGEIAVTSLSSYKTAYVVTKEGTSLNINSVVGLQAVRNQNRNFNHPEASNYDQAASLPAAKNFPQEKYDSSQLIEVVNYAPKYDGVGTRNQARQSRTATVSNGKTAYYLQQDSGRKGWCVVTDESAQYSDFTCVNIANSPKAAFTVLNSLSISN
jgi:hypothetical protein